VRNNFEMLFENGVDFENRMIFFGTNSHLDSDEYGGFTIQSAEKVCRALIAMEKANPDLPIQLHVTSQGGDIYALVKIIDTIEALKCPVHFIGSGIIASSAAYLMCVCDERKLYKNSTVMIHSLRDSEGDGETYENLKVAAKERESVQEKLNKVLEENSLVPKKIWTELISRDLYLTPRECVTLGICDEIISSERRTKFRDKRVAQLIKTSGKKKTILNLIQSLFNRIELKTTLHFFINKVAHPLKTAKDAQKLEASEEKDKSK